MQISSSLAELEKKLLEDARKKAEEIIRNAEERARRIIEEAEKEWKEKAERERKRAIEEAKMKASIILSEARRDARIKISMAKKEVFDSVVEKASKDLRERRGFDVKKSLLILLKESLEYIDKPSKIIINEKDSQALREVFEEFNIKDIYIMYSDKIIGGVIVESRIGELIDNSYDTRLKRAYTTYAPEIYRILWGQAKV